MIWRVPKYPWQWTPWPLTRLLIVAVALSLQAQLMFGWDLRLGAILAFPGQILKTLCFLTLLSSTLACLYALLFLAPLLIVGWLNIWLYDCSLWFFSMVFRLGSDRLLAGFSLCSEVALFVWGFFLLQRSLTGF